MLDGSERLAKNYTHSLAKLWARRRAAASSNTDRKVEDRKIEAWRFGFFCHHFPVRAGGDG